MLQVPRPDPVYQACAPQVPAAGSIGCFGLRTAFFPRDLRPNGAVWLGTIWKAFLSLQAQASAND